ncbi:hypothetical protein AAFC00_000779 [Neodothiora populina]|uniref:alpha-amylase n=1 Tax=Neodothiora populina TaxID=2781224 RepID=A0ABR3PLQ6_9PEZI
MLFLPLSIIFALCGQTIAASTADWRSRSIYQVLTDRYSRTDGSTTAPCNTEDRAYCGGTFQGIISHLDYIQGMGFTAIWISPVTFQVQGTTDAGEAYHGYWQQDLYQINSNFGTASDLQSLASVLHDRGMYLMVDIVVNHNGWAGDSDSVDYSAFNPFNSQDDYHPYCPIDYDNSTSLTQCWMGDSSLELVDLKTESDSVASGYQTWISQLVSEYSIDGLRIDTAMEVNRGFWSGFMSAADMFATGEYNNDDVNTVCEGQNYLPSVLNYAIYFPLFAAFSSTSGDMSALSSMVNSVKSTCSDVTALCTFSENHDQPRFASVTGDMSLAQNILSFTILADGIPIVYQGQEQHYDALGGSNDPYNREALWLSGFDTTSALYTLTAKLNALRNHAISAASDYLDYNNYVIYGDTSTIAMRKGYDGTQSISVLTNLGLDGGDDYTLSLGNTGWTSGTQVMEVLGCTSATVDDSGNLPVPMSSGYPRVYYEQSAVCDWGLCSC